MSKAAKPLPPRDFESAVAELERLVADMESGQLSLDASLAAYKRGVELTAYCQKTLDGAEQQIRILEDGHLQQLQPLAPEPGDD